jgi:putative peptide zinc metalloprotease protein
MAIPPKLELLTRTPGETGFEIRELQSSQAHLQYRPQRLPSDAWEITPQPHSPDGTRTYILKNLQRDRYLLLNSREYFLWELFDGTHSLEEIARSFHFAFGAFDYAAIRQLLAKMYQVGLLVEPGALALHQSRAPAKSGRRARHLSTIRRRWRRLSFTVPNADHLCSILYRRGGFLLFNRVTLWASIAITTAAIVCALRLAHDAREFTHALSAAPLLSTGAMLVTMLVVSMFHVSLHALACKAYGRRVREIGFFLLQGVLPTFYADVTDIFMSTRRARVIVDLAGPMVEVVFGSIAFIAAYASAPGVGQALLFGIGVLLWEGALLNLYPFNFLEMDGYNIVADLLAMPTLRQQALALAPKLPGRLLKAGKIQRVEWIQIAYLALCLVSVFVYVIAHLDALRALLPSWR